MGLIRNNQIAEKAIHLAEQGGIATKNAVKLSAMGFPAVWWFQKGTSGAGAFWEIKNRVGERGSFIRF